MGVGRGAAWYREGYTWCRLTQLGWSYLIDDKVWVLLDQIPPCLVKYGWLDGWG